MYILDNLLFAMTEFIPAFVPIYNEAGLLIPFFSNFLDIGMIYCFRMIIADMFKQPPSKKERIAHIIIVIILTIFTALSNYPFGRGAYRATEQMLVIVVVFYSLHVFYKHLHTIKSNRGWLIFTFVACSTLHITGAVEAIIIALNGPKPFTFRIFSYEIFGLLCTIAAIIYLYTQIKHRPVKTVTEEELFTLFITQYQLTPREAELVPLLLKGANNAAICEEKHISLNTVKVHTHNIYQKLGIERRGQLAAKYGEFKSSRNET